jgi:histidyl-tRNA synthetase
VAEVARAEQPAINPGGTLLASVANVEDLYDAGRAVARLLREAGVRTTTPLEPRKLGKEIARADKAGARAVVIIGPDDWASGNVAVRDCPPVTSRPCTTSTSWTPSTPC